MAKAKPIYPTEEWIEKWIDRYLETATERVTDFDAVREKAMDAWWENEIEHDRATPFDLTEEEEKESKKARKGMARAVNAYGKEVKRERKPNEVKRWAMSVVKTLFEGLALNGKCEAVTLSNVERSLDFVVDGKHYTLTLTEHRQPKG